MGRGIKRISILYFIRDIVLATLDYLYYKTARFHEVLFYGFITREFNLFFLPILLYPLCLLYLLFKIGLSQQVFILLLIIIIISDVTIFILLLKRYNDDFYQKTLKKKYKNEKRPFLKGLLVFLFYYVLSIAALLLTVSFY